tara:strand:- start:782 stop:1330 length:549 start_codon:yes stop_codon:yes gene_type:complete
MKNIINDPLLMIGKAITIFLQAMMALGAVVLAVLTPALLFFRDNMVAGMDAAEKATVLALPLGLLAGVMMIGLIILVLLFFFFDRLRRIIGTVGEGDPFLPANAQRLSMMAWLMLGAQVLLAPASAIGIQLMQYADEAHELNAEVDGGGIDASGILLVILLFILARVFRKGTEMREDLEGTV